MPPYSVDRGLAQIDLERAWARAMAHSRRAGSVYTTSAIVFVLGQIKFSTLVPVAEASLWEVVLWLSSIRCASCAGVPLAWTCRLEGVAGL